MKIIGKIFAVLSSILYFFILTALMASVFSLNLLSSNYYTKVMKSVDLKEIKVNDLGDAFEGVEQVNKDDSLEDVFVKYFTESGIDEELARAVINNEKIREVAGKFIGDYMNYMAGGERPVILREDVEAVFNEPVVKELLAQSPEKMEVDIDKIYNQLNDLIDELVEGGGRIYDNTKRNNEVNIIG